MTNDEYRQLIEFLGQKFGEVDRQFVEVRRDIAMLQDGLTETRGELTAFRQETRREFEDVRALIRLSYADLDRRARPLGGER